MSDITIDVVDLNGKKAGSTDLPAALFGVEPNIPLIHQVVVAQLAAGRAGTHATKTRGEVRGGGIKPWRQKGTGRARHGSRRSPIWVGGGTVHGPTPRSYAQRTPKKMVAAALRGALSDRAAEGRVYVVNNLVEGDTPSTKAALQAIKSITSTDKVLVALGRDEDVAWLSLRNAVNIHALAVDQLNAYDVLVADEIIFTATALETFIAGPTKGKAGKSEPTNTELAATVVEDTAEPTEVSTGSVATDYEGSVRGDNPPAGFDIKGNEDSMKFHTPDSPWYARTVAEVWFNSAEAAEKAGFVNAVQAKDEEGSK